jgi:hypothetical protein
VKGPVLQTPLVGKLTVRMLDVDGPSQCPPGDLSIDSSG